MPFCCLATSASSSNLQRWKKVYGDSAGQRESFGTLSSMGSGIIESAIMHERESICWDCIRLR
ncbi:hypothetical protein FRX31_031045, partial [Thalictrum thalictroides]